MDGGPIAPGLLGLVQERNIGLRNLGVNVLQPDVHRAHGNGQFLKTGEKVEKVVGGQCQFGGFGVLRHEFQCRR